MPEVCAALDANAAPDGSAAAVSDVIAPPSGSVAVTVNVRSTSTLPFIVAGAATTGARSGGLPTKIEVDAEPDKAFVAVNVAEKLPACENVGVHESVPAVFVPFAANVAPAVIAVPVAVSEVIAWASGSDAVTLTVRSEFSFTDAVAGAVTTGARSVPAFSTVIVKLSVSPEPPALAPTSAA